MITDKDSVLSVKLRRLFDSLDTNDNGVLSVEDFTLIADRSASASPAPAEKVERLRRALEVIWDRHLRQMDYSGNGHIDPEEFERGVREAIESDLDGFVSALQESLAARLAIFDADDTGLVDIGTYTIFCQAVSGAAPENVATAFAKLDRDGDGHLEPDEIRSAVIEYFTSEDPDAVGNWLYGPLQSS